MASKRKAAEEKEKPADVAKKSKRTSVADKRKAEEPELADEKKPKRQASVKSKAATAVEPEVKSAKKPVAKATPTKKKKVAEVVEEDESEEVQVSEEEEPLPPKRSRAKSPHSIEAETAAATLKKPAKVKQQEVDAVAVSAPPTPAPRKSGALVVSESKGVQHEILGLWAQYYAALLVARNTMLPVFLVSILASYFLAKASPSAAQTIANSGLLMLFTFCIIMGSYAVVLVPFLVISNLIESKILSENPNAAIYGRLLSLALLATALGAYYGYFSKF